jgi:putative inorganic carbon (HCO3(-)) transporter
VDFFLLILLTAIYLIRPGDWLPSLSSVPMFQIVILSCLAISFEQWSKKLSLESLRNNPITLCVLGLLVTAFISQLLNAPGEIATAFGFSKACVFYLLIISIVNSEPRLRSYLQWLAVIVLGLAFLMIKGQEGAINIGGEMVEVVAKKSYRAQAVGGKNFDPNDTAAILVLGVLISAHFVISSRGIVRRVLWGMSAAITMSGLLLTDSRGGFMALCLGVAAYVFARWGWKGLAVGLCLLPVVAVRLASSRMFEAGAVAQGTGQARVQLWHSGFTIFTHNPLFGIGPDQFTNVVGKASHNSFIQSYAELGFAGGTFFVGAFYFAVVGMYRRVRGDKAELQSTQDPQSLAALLIAILAAYPLAIFALNHLYSAGTYLVLSLATPRTDGYATLERDGDRAISVQLILSSIGFLVFLYAAAQVLVNW